MKMNKKSICWAAGLSLGGMIALAPGSFAANPPPAVISQTNKVENKAQPRLQPLSVKLGMTLEQQEKLKPILQEEWKKIREINANKTYNQEKKFQEKQKLLVSTIKTVKESKILTDEQFAQWKKIRDQSIVTPPSQSTNQPPNRGTNQPPGQAPNQPQGGKQPDLPRN